MSWVIANKLSQDYHEHLGNTGTWWAWLESTDERVRRFESEQAAKDLIVLLPWPVRRNAIPRELP